MRDSAGQAFGWNAERTIVIGPAASRVIDFRAEAGGFIFH
jgi:hypothetical protein